MRKIINIMCCSTLLISAIFSCSPQKEITKVWKVQDGLAMIEVESVQQGGPAEGYWEIIPDSIQGYSGETAFIWKGDGNMYKDPLVIDAPKTNGPYKLHYEIWVEHAGEYELRISNYHWQEDGDNDAWISINRAKYQKIWDHHTNEFTWSEAIANIAHYQPFPLHQGINTIDIVGRSKNWIIDRLIIYRKGTPDSVWQDESVAHAELVAPQSSDREPPTMPQNLKAEGIGLAAVKLFWQAASDNFQVYEYEIFKNSEKIASSFDAHFVVPALVPDTQYSFSVRAKDFSGNVSEPSKTISIKTKAFSPDFGLEIQEASSAPDIDGEMDSVWQDVPSVALEKKSGDIQSELDASASAKFLWDDDYLYAFFSVTDDLLNTTAKDGVHLDLDLDNSKTDFYSIRDRRYYFTLDNDRVKEVISRDDYVEGVQQARRLDHEGYQMEMAIPWQTLGLQPQAGELIGIGVRLYDVDEGEEPEAILAWKGLGASPQKLGTAKLQ